MGDQEKENKSVTTTVFSYNLGPKDFPAAQTVKNLPTM